MPRPAVGAARSLTQIEVADLVAQIEPNWNPNCEVVGGGAVNVPVVVRIGPDGRLLERPVIKTGTSRDPIIQAAEDRAMAAVSRTAPFRVRPNFGTQAIVFNLNARNACANRARRTTP